MLQLQRFRWVHAALLILAVFAFFNLIGCDSSPPSRDEMALRLRRAEVVHVLGTDIWREGAGRLIIEGGHDKLSRFFGFACSCGTFIFFFAIEAWVELESRVWQAFWALLFIVLGAGALTGHGRIVLDSQSKKMTEDTFVLGIRSSHIEHQYDEFEKVSYEIETDSDGAPSGYGLHMHFHQGKGSYKLLRGLRDPKDVPGLLGLISEMAEVKIEAQPPL